VSSLPSNKATGNRLRGLLVNAVFLAVAPILAGCGVQPDGPDERPVLDLTQETYSISRMPDDLETRPTVVNDELTVPPGTKMDFFVDVPAESTVIFDTVAGAPLTISVERAMGGPRAEQTVGPTEVPVRIVVPDGANRLALVTLEPAPGTSATDSSVLLKPRIVSTTPAPKSEPPVVRDGSTVAGGVAMPNIIVYLIDALRTDHLGVYGYEKPVSPHIDTFARRATVFEDAVAQTSWTRSAVASIFTGLDPLRTGVIGRDDALSSSAETLAERLKDCGYTTAALVFNGNAGEKYSLDQGFDFFIRSHRGNYYSDVLNTELFRLLDSGKLKEPFFLYIHTIDPHAPYLPPDEWRLKFAADVQDPGLGEMDRLKQLKKMRKKKVARGEPLDRGITADVIALYDAEIGHNDATFGQVLDKLESMELLDRSAMIFLADHGEEFWDHGGWPHGETLYTEVLSIPLIIKHPLQETGTRTGTLVQQADLFPTVLDYAKCLEEEDTVGRSLRSIVESRGEPVPLPVFSVLDLDSRSGVSITTEAWKLILPLSKHLGRQPMLFDRTTDPRETTNVFEDYPIVAGYMLKLLHQQRNLPSAPLIPEKAVVDEELAKELRALGYLE
jgi:arylsulfatase A-like enzyme